MTTLGAPLDFAKLEGRQFRAHILSTAPSSPVTGQLYYNSTDNTLYWWNNTQWVAAQDTGGAADATTSTKGVIQLAGDLAGTASSPQIATGVIVDADINASAAIAESKLALATDAAAGTGSRRTLGSGALQAMPGNRTLDAITAPVASVSLNSQKITSLADPTANTDAANKQYVDNLIQGLDSHPSVKAATTANITTLAGGAPNTLDGVTLAANDRILVKDQTTQSANGIYIVQTLGTGSNGTWVRATDQDTWAEVPSAYVWVEQGTTNADTGWTCTADQGGTLNTTAITWVLFSSAGSVIAGNGLTKTGNTIDVVGTSNRISVAADSIDIAATYVGQSSITTLGTITTGVWQGTTIAIANGGTGQTTAKTARETGLGAAGYYSSATHGSGTTISITQATHGLRASRGLIVQVLDEATGAVELPDISVASSGDVTVTYAASVSANSKRVTVIG